MVNKIRKARLRWFRDSEKEVRECAGKKVCEVGYGRS